ncbi:DUF6884 domain-containing protein [Streptomyces sp. NPDC050095]|uniref:DUF6884 domain-containing protein n=1 Tax=unclassified Streptomyces TaxID=2593676 RepID=UPI003432F077
MNATKNLHVPGQIRRHVIKDLKPKTPGERELRDACVTAGEEMKAKGQNTLSSCEIKLTMPAFGAALDLARSWRESNNGNNVMAAKSFLKHELEYEPDDPREIRHEIKMPKSLARQFNGPFTLDFKKDKSIPVDAKSDMRHMSWTATGTSGRVRAVTLGWFLEECGRLQYHDHSAVSRAAKKFVTTYTEPYDKTQRLINGYLGTDEDEIQEKDLLTADDFQAAIRGRGPEPENEPEVQPKRLVIIACGGKKSDAPGKIPAEERYTGNYFRACLMAAEVMDGSTMVLSAKYGLIPLSEEIENYDVKLGDKGSVRLSAVRQQVEALGLEDAKVTVLGGEKYVTGVRQIWSDAEAPLKGGIGQQLQQLAGMYSGEVLEDDERQDDDAVQTAEEPQEFHSGPFRNIPSTPDRHRPAETVIWFGGKAGRGHPEPRNWTRVTVTYCGEGEHSLYSFETGDFVMRCKGATKVYWALGNVPSRTQQAIAELEAPAGEGTGRKLFDVPENFLDLAGSANTPQARRYWQKRCVQWRLTGQ